MDSGLLGERMLLAMADAAARLSRPDMHMLCIPHSARVYGMFVESVEVRKRRALMLPSHIIAADEETLEEQRFPVQYVYDFLCAGGGIDVEDDYTCEQLDMLPHKPLCEPFHIFDVTFGGLSDQTDGLNAQPATYVTITSSGCLDAFVYWFETRLLKSEPVITFTTAPGREECAWDQAVLFLHPCRPVNECGGVHVARGARVHAQFGRTSADDRLWVTVADTITGEALVSSKSAPCMHPFRQNHELVAVSEERAVGEMDMAAMNDLHRNAAYFSSIHAVCDGISDRGALRVLEMTGNYSSFILSCLACASSALSSRIGAVTTLSPSEQSALCIEQCAISCGYIPTEGDWLVHPASRVIARVVAGTAVDACLSAQSEHVPRQELLSLQLPVFDLCICDVVEGSGLVRQRCLEELHFVRQFASDPMRPLRTIPYSVEIVLAVVESDALLQAHRVLSERTAGVDVSGPMNTFASSRLQELDLDHIPGLRWVR
jgi:hypothetical protein